MRVYLVVKQLVLPIVSGRENPDDVRRNRLQNYQLCSVNRSTLAVRLVIDDRSTVLAAHAVEGRLTLELAQRIRCQHICALSNGQGYETGHRHEIWGPTP